MKDNFKKPMSLLTGLLISVVWIFLFKIGLSFFDKTLINSIVLQTSGLIFIGILIGFITKNSSVTNIWAVFPAIIIPIIFDVNTINNNQWIYSIWLSIISVLIVIQGIKIGVIIRSSSKKKSES